MALADLNGDGKLDVVVADVEVRAINVLLGRGDGSFQPRKLDVVSNDGTAAG